MTDANLVADIALLAALVFMAWVSLRSANLFSGIVLFVIFGLLMALAWVRLQAPDIALAEAAISSGMTGALLLGALGRFERRSPETRSPGTPTRSLTPQQALSMIGAVVLFVGLAGSVLRMPAPETGTAALVGEALTTTGVGNRVTAVVLDFRGYDTLLEIGVLVLALLGLTTLAGTTAAPPPPNPQLAPVILALVRLFTPIIVVVAGYMLWSGTHQPGGAFQAGALLAGMGVILLMSGMRLVDGFGAPPWRLLVVAGLLVFLLTGLGVMISGRFLEYPRHATKTALVLIETACTLSIAGILLALFAGCAGYLGGRNAGRARKGAS